jgi:hypothetical protein
VATRLGHNLVSGPDSTRDGPADERKPGAGGSRIPGSPRIADPGSHWPASRLSVLIRGDQDQSQTDTSSDGLPREVPAGALEQTYGPRDQALAIPGSADAAGARSSRADLWLSVQGPYDVAMAPSKRGLLTGLSLGKRVAEEEVDDLALYFVETEQWRKVLADEVDVIFGSKGAGKSALYSALLQRERNCLIAECS